MVLRGQNCFYWRFQCHFMKNLGRKIPVCQIFKTKDQLILEDIYSQQGLSLLHFRSSQNWHISY